MIVKQLSELNALNNLDFDAFIMGSITQPLTVTTTRDDLHSMAEDLPIEELHPYHFNKRAERLARVADLFIFKDRCANGRTLHIILKSRSLL